MKTIKNMKGIKPLSKNNQQKINGGSAELESLEAAEADASKPRPPLLLIVLHNN